MKNKQEPFENENGNTIPDEFMISDQDIHEAMKEIPGYLDITASDFKELYRHSYRHALDRLVNSTRAAEIMIRNVVTVELLTPLHEVADRMASSGVSGVPVLDQNGQVPGIISERDFLKHMGAERASFMSIVAECIKGKGCAALGIRKGVARDIMSAPVRCVHEFTPLAEVAEVMTRYAINRVPVLDEKGDKLLGIITRSDLVKARVLG